MNYDEFDSPGSQDREYLGNDDEEALRLPPRRTRVTVNLSWRQIAFILCVNAIISLVISLLVVIVAGPKLPAQPGVPITFRPTASEATSPAADRAGGKTSQAQPVSSSTPALPGDTLIPTAQPLPAETSIEPTTYVVQPGDTLSNIARKFEISLEDLMLANGLSDPDYVQVGQELLIPIGGLPLLTPTFTPVPVPTDTPLPFNPPTPLPSGGAPPAEPAATVGPTSTPVPTLASAAESEIRLVLQALSAGDLANEMMQVVNQGPFVRLSGWTLSDATDNVYTFPDFSLWPGGAINIHTAAGSNTITDLYWGQSNPVWSAGEVATLRNAKGNVVAIYTVPAP